MPIPVVWGTPANFNGFHVLASLLQRRWSTEANQTLHDVWPLPVLVVVDYMYIFGGCCPVMEFCQVQNSLCVLQVLYCPIGRWHSSSEHEPNFAALSTGHHLYSAWRPSRWALAHILVLIIAHVMLPVASYAYWSVKFSSGIYGIKWPNDAGVHFIPFVTIWVTDASRHEKPIPPMWLVNFVFLDLLNWKITNLLQLVMQCVICVHFVSAYTFYLYICLYILFIHVYVAWHYCPDVQVVMAPGVSSPSVRYVSLLSRGPRIF